MPVHLARQGGVVGEFAQLDLPAGALAQSEGESGEGVGGSPGPLRGLLPLVPYEGRLGRRLVGLGADRTRLGQLGLGLLGERACVVGRRGELGEPPRRTARPPGGEPCGQLPVLGEPCGQLPDLLVPFGRARAQRLPLLVGGVLVVHGGVRRYEEDVSVARVGGRGRGEQRGGRADGDGGAREQRGVGEGFAGPRVGVRVRDDHAVDQLGPRGEHARVVDGVDGLREIAPAGERGDAVLAQVLHGGQHVGARRQQSAVTERAEDPRVVGGGGPQLEELPLGGGDPVVEELSEFVGVVVQLLGGEGDFTVGPGVRGRAATAPRASAPRVGAACGRGPPAGRASAATAGNGTRDTARRVPLPGPVRSFAVGRARGALAGGRGGSTARGPHPGRPVAHALAG